MIEDYDVGYERITLPPRRLTCIRRQSVCASTIIIIIIILGTHGRPTLPAHHLIVSSSPLSREQLIVLRTYVEPSLHPLSLGE